MVFERIQLPVILPTGTQPKQLEQKAKKYKKSSGRIRRFAGQLHEFIDLYGSVGFVPREILCGADILTAHDYPAPIREVGLYRSVLIGAIVDRAIGVRERRKVAERRNPEKIRDGRLAQDWFYDRVDSAAVTCPDCCEVLGLDYSYLVSRLIENGLLVDGREFRE